MKVSKLFSQKHSKKWTVVAALAVGLGMALFTAIPRAITTAATQRDLPIYCVQKDSKVCSLTFDAAWVMQKCGSPLFNRDCRTFFVITFVPPMSLFCKNLLKILQNRLMWADTEGRCSTATPQRPALNKTHVQTDAKAVFHMTHDVGFLSLRKPPVLNNPVPHL